MKVAFEVVKEIYKTLPTGYYLGRKINHRLVDNTMATYYDPLKDEIVVSYPLIARALDAADDTLFTKNYGLDSLVRGLLYHEISHAILTPTNLFKYAPAQRNHNVVNVVEDERIETLLATTFLKVNFKKNCIVINNYRGEKPTSAWDAFYQLVRYHKGEYEWVERLTDLIIRYKDINATTDWRSEYYVDEILEFYNDFVEAWNKAQEAQAQANSNEQNNEQNNETSSGNSSNENEEEENEEENENENGTSESEENEEEEGEEESEESEESETATSENEEEGEEEEETSENGNEETSEEETSEGEETPEEQANGETSEEDSTLDELTEDIETLDISALDEEEIKKSVGEAIDKIFNKYVDTALETRLMDIVIKKLKQNAQMGGAINAYSGRLDYRAVGNRDDYRWWVANNRMGHLKHNTKVHFTLFLDNSGSFEDNDDNMNIFIRTLDKVAKAYPDFTFDIVTMCHYVEEWADHNQIFDSHGGTALRHSIKDVIRRHQKVDANNYCLVLFDGDAHWSDEFRGQYYSSNDPFKHFDMPTTIIISDKFNEHYIRNSVHQARVKYCENFVDEFIDAICSLLERVI